MLILHYVTYLQQYDATYFNLLFAKMSNEWSDSVYVTQLFNSANYYYYYLLFF